jgi:hypothetical protein
VGETRQSKLNRFFSTTDQIFKMNLVTILIILQVYSTTALYFYLNGNENKCFLEELPKETTVIGSYYSGISLLSLSRNVRCRHQQIRGTSKRRRADRSRGNAQQASSDESKGRFKGKVSCARIYARFSFSAIGSGDHVICMSMNYTGWFNHPKTVCEFF